MSLLIERFAMHGDALEPAIPEREIVQCVKSLRRKLGLRAVAPGRLEPFLTSRNIRDVATADDLKADGALVPLGAHYSDGFRMILRRNLPEGRINFTVAHEICHTFFYERAPEIKFLAHPVDPQEERLCNCGAEELLMPAFDVKRRAKNKPKSLEVLEEMAAYYRVSAAAMLIRFRTVGLWNAELVLWHEMTNGSFAVKRQWGGKKFDWQWLDSGIPRAALGAASNKVSWEHSYWIVQSPQGQRFRPVWYQIKRHGNEVLALVLHKHKEARTQAERSAQSVFFPRKSPVKSTARR